MTEGTSGSGEGAARITEEDIQRHRVSFDLAVADYERARPGYPDRAVRWMVPANSRDVLDLGAGTGKLARVAAAAGFTVTAVEPLDGMRAELRRQLPHVRALAGSAEEIPLAAASVDAVLVGQAWHWFDQERAVPEVTRVLRPGGSLGLVWNDLDNSVPWVATLREITSGAVSASRYGVKVDRQDSDRKWEPRLGPAFDPPEWTTFALIQHQDLPTLLANLSSRSYLITLTGPEREQVLADVTDLLRTHPDTAGLDTYRLPYRTRCMRAMKRP
jgi:SAM-dependent methyltransferase